MWARYSARMLVGCWLAVTGHLWGHLWGHLSGQLWAAAERQPPSPAAKLLAQALDADAAGDIALYGQLMRRALQTDPDFELARWHLGQVYFQGRWRSAESVARIVSHDSRWQEYRERLRAASATIEAHVELARWCQRQELENEEKWHWYQVYSHHWVTPLSCFAAGTPVWTQAGPVAIERIQAGALVLSQDPVTGRLDYRPVVDTTIRPPSALLQLEFNEETITTTLGHRFWVTGAGWRMAKFLEPGERLFCPRGSIGLRSAAAAEQDLAYNLVVGDYHTYFVGGSRLLVHDNSCPQPTTTALPGVSEQVASR